MHAKVTQSRLKKSPFWALLIAISLLLQGCSAMKVEDYKGTQPQLDLFAYFAGNTKAYGQFQDRSGKVLRRFEVDIVGSINESQDTLTLEEDFIYDDGEKQRRVWVIKKLPDGSYSGTAGDVVGAANGRIEGFALNWSYTLDLPYKDSSIHVKFDDWMFLHNEDVMLNRAEVTKWGFRVGEVTLFFSKKLANS